MLLAELLVRIGVDRTQLNSALKGVEGDMSRLGANMSRSFQSVGSSMTKALTIPITLLIGYMTKAAGDSEQLAGKFHAVFGEMSGDAEKWAKIFASSVNTSNNLVKDAITTFYNIEKSMGATTDAAFTMSKGLATAAYDMAAFYDISPAEAIDKIKSALVGHSRGLLDLGIVVTNEKVKEQMLREGIDGTVASLDLATKSRLRYELILRGSSAAQGQALREVNTFNAQLQALKDNFKQMASTMGNSLLSPITAIIKLLNKFMKQIEDMSPEQRKQVISTLMMIAVIGPLLLIFGKLTGVIFGVIGAFRTLALVFMSTKALALAIVTVLIMLLTAFGVFKSLEGPIATLKKKFADMVGTVSTGAKPKIDTSGLTAAEKAAKDLEDQNKKTKESADNLQGFDTVYSLSKPASDDSAGAGLDEASVGAGGGGIFGNGEDFNLIDLVPKGLLEWIAKVKAAFKTIFDDFKTDGFFGTIGKMIGEFARLHPWITGVAVALTVLLIPALVKTAAKAVIAQAALMFGGAGSIVTTILSPWKAMSSALFRRSAAAVPGEMASAAVGGADLVPAVKAGLMPRLAGAMGSTATGAGAAVAGTAAATGLTIAAVSLGKSIHDIYKGSKNTDKKAGTAQKWQGGTGIATVGAGALAGAAIGSVVPVIGTAIGAAVGAGIGGVVSLWKGKQIGAFFQKEFGIGKAALKDWASNTSDAMAKWGTSISDGATKLGAFFLGIGGNISKFATSIGTGINNIGPNVKKLTSSVFNSVKEIITSRITSMWKSIEFIGGLLSKLFTGIGTAFGKIGTAISKFFTGIGTQLGKAGASISNFFTGIGTGLNKAGASISNFFTGIGTGLNKAATAVSSFISTTGKNITSGIASGWNGLSTWASGAASKITSGLSNVGGAVKKSLSSIGSSMVGWCSSAFSGLLSYITDIPGRIMDGVMKGVEKLKGAVNWVKDKFTSGYSESASTTSPAKVNGSYAGGLDSVPFDGFIAELHKGEAVLTSEQAEQWRKGLSGTGSSYSAQTQSSGTGSSSSAQTQSSQQSSSNVVNVTISTPLAITDTAGLKKLVRMIEDVMKTEATRRGTV